MKEKVMKVSCNYCKEESWAGSLEIEDTGNVSIVANNDDGNTYYFNVSCKLGIATITSFGPLKFDEAEFDGYFNYNKFILEPNEKKIYTNIFKGLNDNNKNITQAEIISNEEFKDKLNEIKNIL